MIVAGRLRRRRCDRQRKETSGWPPKRFVHRIRRRLARRCEMDRAELACVYDRAGGDSEDQPGGPVISAIGDLMPLSLNLASIMAGLAAFRTTPTGMKVFLVMVFALATLMSSATLSRLMFWLAWPHLRGDLIGWSLIPGKLASRETIGLISHKAALNEPASRETFHSPVPPHASALRSSEAGDHASGLTPNSDSTEFFAAVPFWYNPPVTHTTCDPLFHEVCVPGSR